MSLEPGDDAKYLIEWDSGCCEASATSIVMSGDDPNGAVDVQIWKRESAIGPVQHHDRVVLAAPALEALETFAHRTYAPNTEASRIAGAGPS